MVAIHGGLPGKLTRVGDGPPVTVGGDKGLANDPNHWARFAYNSLRADPGWAHVVDAGHNLVSNSAMWSVEDLNTVDWVPSITSPLDIGLRLDGENDACFGAPCLRITADYYPDGKADMGAVQIDGAL